MSYNEAYCQSKNIEPGDCLLKDSELGYLLLLEDEEFFNINHIEWAWRYHNDFQHLHFGFLMHCLVFHSELDIHDIFMIDEVKINVVVRHQFFTDKPWVERLKKINSDKWKQKL